MEPNQLPSLKKNAGLPFPGNPAISMRPVAFRPRLAAGLAIIADKLCKNYSKLSDALSVWNLANIIFKLSIQKINSGCQL